MTEDNNTLVYLSGPITKIGVLRARLRNSLVAEIVNRQGFTTFDPAAAFTMKDLNNSSMLEVVQNINDYTIHLCQAMVVPVYGSGATSESFGTLWEISLCWELEIPLVFYNYSGIFNEKQAHEQISDAIDKAMSKGKSAKGLMKHRIYTYDSLMKGTSRDEERDVPWILYVEDKRDLGAALAEEING